MKGTFAIYIADLAESLGDLRRRFRQAARVEVARTVAETLQEFTMTAILGNARSAARAQVGSSWDDPWREDSGGHSWHSEGGFPDPFEEEGSDQDTSSPPLRAALILALGAARFSYRRTRQPIIALVLGAVVIIVVLIGGPTAEALADAWATATDLAGVTNDRIA